MKARSHRHNLDLFIPKLGLIKIYLPTFLFIIFIYLLTENTNISVYELVADPNEVGQVAFYTGFVSTIGILFFCATVSVCIFSAYLIASIGTKDKKWSLFLKYSGYLILILLIDDLWQIHENLPSLLFGSNINSRAMQDLGETVIMGIYVLLFCAYLIRFRRLIYQTKLPTLFLAILFFGLSGIIDIFLANISGHFIFRRRIKTFRNC